MSWKGYKAVTADLKRIYQTTTQDQALSDLERFSQQWSEQYPQIAKSWSANWGNLRTFFEYPPEIRKAIYTTTAIESHNSVIRSATKRRQLFPRDDSVMKVIYLAISQAAKNGSCQFKNGVWR